MFLVKSPRGDLLTKYHKEFKDLTGITVGSEMIPEQQQRQKAVIEFNSGNPSFDVIAISYHVQKRLFGKGKWLEDLRPLIADKSLTEPDFDFADFSKGGMAWATQADGRDRHPAVQHRSWMLYYNKELFDAKGVAYPEDLRRDGRRGREAERSGARASPASSARGLKNANMPVWTSFLLGYGGGFVDRNGKLMTDTRRGDRGGEDVPDAAHQVPARRAWPASTGTSRRACSRRARAAMWLDGIGFAPPLEDPTKSRIVGKVGYGVMPPGPEGAGLGDVRRRHRHLGVPQEEGPGLALPAVGVQQDQPGAHAAGRGRRAGAQLRLRRPRGARRR